MIARSIISKGLNPMLGLFHKSDSNTFNLADDFIEVFRPIIDSYVYQNLNDSSILFTLSSLYVTEILSVISVIFFIVDKKNKTFISKKRFIFSIAAFLLSVLSVDAQLLYRISSEGLEKPSEGGRK